MSFFLVLCLHIWDRTDYFSFCNVCELTYRDFIEPWDKVTNSTNCFHKQQPACIGGISADSEIKILMWESFVMQSSQHTVNDKTLTLISR